jgi:hypothetical protein
MENPKGFSSTYNPTSGTTTAEQISAGGLSGGLLTLQLPVLDVIHLGGSTTSDRFLG